MLWIGIGQYSVLGVPEDFPFPTDNCQAGNGSMTGGTNRTTLAFTTNLISTTGVTTMAAVPVQELWVFYCLMMMMMMNMIKSLLKTRKIIILLKKRWFILCNRFYQWWLKPLYSMFYVYYYLLSSWYWYILGLDWGACTHSPICVMLLYWYLYSRTGLKRQYSPTICNVLSVCYIGIYIVGLDWGASIPSPICGTPLWGLSLPLLSPSSSPTSQVSRFIFCEIIFICGGQS